MAEQAKLLVIEGDSTTRTMLELALSYGGNGFRVFTAPSGRSALLQLGIVQPDLILLDVTPPGGEGLDTLARIRALSTVPVIAFSAQNDQDTIVRSLEGGADYCLTKPPGIRELKARVRALLRRDRGMDVARWERQATPAGA
jgi:DNA-binding response OmpR family regulator